MSEDEYKNFANQILDEYPELRTVMAQSQRFEELKSQSSLDEAGGQTVYLVNDTQGDEDALYVDALAKGAKAVRKNKPDDVYRTLYLELDDRLRSIVEEKIAGDDV